MANAVMLSALAAVLWPAGRQDLHFEHFERCCFYKKTIGFQCFYVKSDAGALGFCLRLLNFLGLLDVDTDFDIVFTGVFSTMIKNAMSFQS